VHFLARRHANALVHPPRKFGYAKAALRKTQRRDIPVFIAGIEIGAIER
jgi:hypothetical protein